MDNKHVAFPFRWIFPLGQLVLCLLILWPDRFYVLGQWAGPRFIEKLYEAETRHSSGSNNATKSERDNTDDSVNLVLPDYPEIEREMHRKDIRMAIPASLNCPVLWVELPFTAFSTSKREWTPHGMDFRVWRATVWPLAGLLFWWMIGRGMEALVAARRKLIAPCIRWIEVIIAAIILAEGVLVLIIFIGEMLEEPRAPDVTLNLLAAGGFLWIVLAAITLIARIAQWRIRKAMRAAPEASLPG